MLMPMNTLLQEIERRALEIAAVLDARDGKRMAEIKPETMAKWHMAKVMPGNEYRTADKLGMRGVGSFVPKFDSGSVIEFQRTNEKGRPVIEKIDVGNKLIFPGRVFIFVWDILDHWRRVKSCPGVNAIVVDGYERPVVVPDSEIAKMQVLQFCLLPKGKPKRKRYKTLDERHQATMCTRSFWSIDPAQRNRVLDSSLGLAS